MAHLTINLDDATEASLQKLSESAGVPPAEYVARLLRRTVRSKQPRPAWDEETIRANAVEFANEDLALAESDLPHRAQLLADEDSTQ